MTARRQRRGGGPRAVRLQPALWQQFLLYLKKALTGDFGNSVLSTYPVMQDIRRVFPATLELATVGTLIGSPSAFRLGAGRRQARQPDRPGRARHRAVRLFDPIFWLGLVGLLVFYAKLGWVEGPGRIGVAYEYTSRRSPASSCSTRSPGRLERAEGHFRPHHPAGLPARLFLDGYISRMTRSFMLNELEQEYIVAARAKGLSGDAESGAMRSATPPCRW